jgi:hypothetical protein
MRPKSIVIFDWIYLGSLVLGLINSALSYSALTQRFRTDPALAPMGDAGAPFVVVTLAISTAVMLVLWFFISRRASNAAKWILTGLTILGVLGVVQSLQLPVAGVSFTGTLIITALQCGAVYLLFRKDAAAWLSGTAPIDPDVFR